MIYRRLVRPLLFQFPAEKVHYLTMNGLNLLHRFWPSRQLLKMMFQAPEADRSVNCLGLEFKNRVGLAAGFDKDARFIHALQDLGFGHIEVGTVTPRPQAGNPKPRLFRLKKDEAIINRMGFNNRGLEAMIEKLKDRPKDLIIGGNIGKNKDTPNEKAVDDYLQCFEGLHPYVDYFVVNVSSPNTPGLRELQERGPLLNILGSLKKASRNKSVHRPILLKIAPDLNQDQLDDIVDIVVESGIEGLIATNTTIERKGLQSNPKEVENIGAGGLSGRPVHEHATEVLSYLNRKAKGRFTLIGVGGVRDKDTAQAKLNAGAQLLQVYSGFIFEGPSLIKRIKKGIK